MEYASDLHRWVCKQSPTAMNIFETWDQPTSPQRLHIVFSNRQQQYGAFVLRRDYDSVVLKSFGIVIAALVFVSLAPALLRHFHSGTAGSEDEKKEVILQMTEVILPEKSIPVPPEKMPSREPERRNSSVQFTQPVIIDNDSSDLLTQQKLLSLETGPKTVAGDSGITEPFKDTDSLSGKDMTVGGVFTYVEEMPEFPGGENAMLGYLAKNIRYPSEARETSISGTVYISFIVHKDGSIGEIELLRGIGGGCEEEAIRVIRNMPRWRPGKQNGNTVNVQYKLPVNFKIK